MSFQTKNFFSATYQTNLLLGIISFDQIVNHRSKNCLESAKSNRFSQFDPLPSQGENIPNTFSK